MLALKYIYGNGEIWYGRIAAISQQLLFLCTILGRNLVKRCCYKLCHSAGSLHKSYFYKIIPGRARNSVKDVGLVRWGLDRQDWEVWPDLDETDEDECNILNHVATGISLSKLKSFNDVGPLYCLSAASPWTSFIFLDEASCQIQCLYPLPLTASVGSIDACVGL